MADEPRQLEPDDKVEPPKIEQGPPPEEEQPQQPPPQNGNGGEPETVSDTVRKARESIPVGERGITPTSYAQQIDIAKDRSKAYLMLPVWLHNNAAVMAALVGIAARFNLDPIMLASQTYVQNNRLCFQSQAFGAILYASKLLIGRLRYEFKGENEDMTCTVSGRFKDDPEMVYSATTPPLKEIHPGHTQKDGKEFVKGSPLWDKDAEQQVAYFAQRRWIRRYAPDCVMGMYTREEIMELDEFRASRDGAITLTADRLGQLETGEGWGEGRHLDMDLAAIEPELPEDVQEDVKEPPAKPAEAKRPVGRPKLVVTKKPLPRGRPPSKSAIKAIVRRAEAGPKRTVMPPPKWLAYVGQSEEWIKAVSSPEGAVDAEQRWEREREMRDKLLVPMGERSRLRAILDRKVAQLRPPTPSGEIGELE